jgi:3-oxoacyl-[acyl-carrier-protein] synthase III
MQMASICNFGRYLPDLVVGNDELAVRLGCDPGWILQMSGIEERRVAAAGETVADMAVAAARPCMTGNVGMVIVSSGSAEMRFPGPAAEVAKKLGLAGIPAIDLPIASAGSLFALTLAARLAPAYGDILVIASEKMASLDTDKNIAILFGDGAGACLVSVSRPGLEIVDSAIHSDGTWCDQLALPWAQPLHMNGASVIRHATAKIPAVIGEVLAQSKANADSVRAFVMHQANQNLMDRVARAIQVPVERFYSNIRKYGNTSSASMLIAASEWYEGAKLSAGDLICMAAFGAGFHWGAVLCRYAPDPSPSQ